MKKIIVLVAILAITTSMTNANEGIVQPLKQVSNVSSMRAQKEAAFEKRLGLTPEQKQKAKIIRMNGHEKIRPIIEEIKSKKQEAKMVKMSRIAVQVQEERLTKIDQEIKILEKKAHEIRKSNMKEFESILTREQKKTLKQMKKEGRKNYHHTHPIHKPRLN